MNANDREVISGLTKQIELLQEQIKSMNEVMVKMLEKDNHKVETEEDRRNKLIEETRSHTEELNKKLEQRERNHNIAYKAKKLGEVVNNFGERVFTMDYLNTLSGFAIDEAYDNYFQDGNCKVGTKKLSDEELEKYEILFEGKKPKEEKKNDNIRKTKKRKDSLINALSGDEDEAYEFKMAFADLCAECERMFEDLQEEWVPHYFDIFFVAAGAGDAYGGLLGFDEYEQDYFGIGCSDSWAEDEAKKKLKQMKKQKLLRVLIKILMKKIH